MLSKKVTKFFGTLTGREYASIGYIVFSISAAVLLVHRTAYNLNPISKEINLKEYTAEPYIIRGKLGWLKQTGYNVSVNELDIKIPQNVAAEYENKIRNGQPLEVRIQKQWPPVFDRYIATAVLSPSN